MHQKGFTLIELLAVIVILAIIALIATPIVLNIIEESKVSATVRSAEYYMDAVEYSLMIEDMNKNTIESGEYNILSNGNICLEYDNNNNSKCVNELVVEVSGAKPTSGTIEIKDSIIVNATIKNDNGIVKKYANGNIEYVGSIEVSPICTLITDTDDNGKITAGDKYQCKVKDNMEEEYEDGYIFYVLGSNEDGTTNLIMNRNICEDGSLATESNVCTYAYNDDVNAVLDPGPKTAMAKLNAATSSWKEELTLNETFDSEYGYFENFALTGKARLPKRAEVDPYDADSKNQYLYDNLDLTCYDNWENMTEVECDVDGAVTAGLNVEGITHIKGISGYWLLSTDEFYSDKGMNVLYSGILLGSNGQSGIRPVITVEI